jgi:hypothetical protein
MIKHVTIGGKSCFCGKTTPIYGKTPQKLNRSSILWSKCDGLYEHEKGKDRNVIIGPPTKFERSLT